MNYSEILIKSTKSIELGKLIASIIIIIIEKIVQTIFFLHCSQSNGEKSETTGRGNKSILICLNLNNSFGYSSSSISYMTTQHTKSSEFGACSISTASITEWPECLASFRCRLKRSSGCLWPIFFWKTLEFLCARYKTHERSSFVSSMWWNCE